MDAGLDRGPRAAGLAAGEVHLWQVRLEVSPEGVADLARVLEPQELARAERMGSEALRRAAIASAAGLRRVLASYGPTDPADLRFHHGARGKPALLMGDGGPPPRFNLAHSGSLALVAVSAGREVGVDLERIDPARVEELLVERVLTARELARWRVAPPGLRAQLFFELWAHKEALMKATGRGLDLDPLSLEVLRGGDRDPVAFAAVLHIRDEAWSLRRLDVGPDYGAALALAGEAAAELRGFELDGTL